MKLVAGAYDSDKSQAFLDNYERYFRSLADEPVTLLELGVHRGGSLLMWRDYFARGKIVGVDAQPCDLHDPAGRIAIFQGEQQDTSFLHRIARKSAPAGFDVIIDDASHIGAQTKTSFWHLLENHLKPGGLYVIEDWCTSYWGKWADGVQYESPDSAQVWPSTSGAPESEGKKPFLSHSYGMAGFIKQLVDELCIEVTTSPGRGWEGPAKAPRFVRMETCPGQVFIVKASR